MQSIFGPRRVLVFGLALLVSLLAISGCTTTSAPYDGRTAGSSSVHEMPDISVAQVDVRVPQSLAVSEENSYHPSADIVWRGDPRGDRHAQVSAIFDTASRRAFEPLHGSRPVIVRIDVLRFHSLTEKARYTVGGVHSITFAMTLHDARTGQPAGPRRIIHADLRAYGGQAAMDADAAGQTQKVRVTGHLAAVLREELANPAAFGAG